MSKAKSLNPGWPQTAPEAPEGTWPKISQPRLILEQTYNNANNLWTISCVAGANNPDGFPAGTYYSITSATKITGT